MPYRPDNEINVKKLAKKYRTNVEKIISAWKKGYSDEEILKLTGIDMFTLQQLKTDIELAHRRLRVERRGRQPKQHHIFLSPLT